MDDLIELVKSQLNTTDMTIDEQIEELDNFGETEKLIDNSFTKLIYNPIKYNESLYIDLEIFEDNLNNKDNSIFSKIDNTLTLFGRRWLINKLKNPINNIDLLNKQKNNIEIINNHLDEFKNELSKIKGLENDIMWFWKDTDESVESLYDMIFFKTSFLKLLNYNESIMLIYNVYNIFITPLTTLLTPLTSIIFLLVIKFYYGIKIPIKNLFGIMKKLFMKQFSSSSNLRLFFSLSIWLLFYVYGIYQSISYSLQINKITNIFHNKLNKISQFMKSAKILYDLSHDMGFPNLDFPPLTNTFFNPIFDKKPSIFRNKGKIISTYYTFLQIKDKLLPFIYFVGELDSLYSSSKLLCDFRNINNKYCLPNYESNDKVNINIKECWHPYLIKNPINNSVNINKNIVITGPNAAGKSTFIKTILLNILFAQTISICSASSLSFTPFNNLHSYLHIPDVKGKESLFEAEMNRCLNYLSECNKNKSDKSLIIMDEIFSSTNSEEGFKAAYLVCKKLSKYKNNLSLLTTHYYDMNKLEKDTKQYKNYKFEIKRDKNNKIIFTYNLKRGASKDYIALELFSNKMKNILT